MPPFIRIQMRSGAKCVYQPWDPNFKLADALMLPPANPINTR